MTKEEVFSELQILHTYASVARKFGVSRQRIHQIVKDYKNTGIHFRINKYNMAWKDLCQKCFKNSSKALHHKDGNNKNDTVSNLIPLCSSCHNQSHILLQKAVKRQCKICKKSKYYKSNKYVGNPMCDRCYMYQKVGKGMYIRQHLKSKECITCHRKFDKITLYKCKNTCYKCYRKASYIKHKDWYRIYYQNHKNPK